MYFALLFFVVESNPSLFPSSAKRILPLENLKFNVQNSFFFFSKGRKIEKNLTGGGGGQPSLALGICEFHQLFLDLLNSWSDRKLVSGEGRKLLFGAVEREFNSRH